LTLLVGSDHSCALDGEAIHPAVTSVAKEHWLACSRFFGPTSCNVRLPEGGEKTPHAKIMAKIKEKNDG
jgi:hypothetical protein